MTKAYYHRYDFSESVQRVTFSNRPVKCLYAWGTGEEDGGSTWSGGFVIELANGTVALLCGWCDYTGWGCQDGAWVYEFLSVELAQKHLSESTDYNEKQFPPISEWDKEPFDINKWINDGMKSWDQE